MDSGKSLGSSVMEKVGSGHSLCATFSLKFSKAIGSYLIRFDPGDGEGAM